jgi:hypothetical protein
MESLLLGLCGELNQVLKCTTHKSSPKQTKTEATHFQGRIGICDTIIFEDVKCVGWAVVNDNTFTVRIAQESFFFLLDVC